MPAVVRAAWRNEDEALLVRLLDESVIERVFQSQVGKDAQPPRRASSLIASLKKNPDGLAAVAAAQEGNLGPLLEQICHPAKLASAGPELLHQLALFHAAVSEAKGGSVDALLRSLTAWLRLVKEGRYLSELGKAVVASSLVAKDLEKALTEAALWPIDDLGKEARQGARELSPKAAASLATLRHVPEAATLAGAPEALSRLACEKAASLAALAIEEALTQPLQALTELATKPDPPAQEAHTLLKRLAAVWSWSGSDESVEHAAIEQTAPLAWAHYRASRWTELGMLIDPIWPLVDSLATRIKADPTKLAYAASTAQMVVFRSDVVNDRTKMMELLERALVICPTHRNTRLRIANELCNDALRLLPGRRAPTHQGYETAKTLITRAEQLYASANGLPEAQKRLLEAKNLLGIKP